MKKKLAVLVVVVAIAAVGVYTFGGRFNWSLFLTSLRDINPWWMTASIVATFATYLIRAYRWQILLEPVKRIRVSKLMETNLIGFSAIYILGRAAEIARPVWVSRREGVPLSASLATVVAERFLDWISLIGLFAWAMVAMEIPADSAAALMLMKRAAWYMLGGSIVALLALFVLRSNLPRFAGWIPAGRISAMMQSFVDGLAFLDKGRSLALSLGYSALLWITIAGQFWLMLRAMRFDWSLAAATLVLVGAAIGSIAQIPGIGGGFQAAFAFCLVTFFQVPAERAVAAGFIAWVASYGPTIIVTAIYMAVSGLKLSELKAAVRRPESETV